MQLKAGETTKSSKMGEKFPSPVRLVAYYVLHDSHEDIKHHHLIGFSVGFQFYLLVN